MSKTTKKLVSKSLKSVDKIMKSIDASGKLEPTHILIRNKNYPIGNKKEIEEALQSARDIKNYNKYGEGEVSYKLMFAVGLFIGIVLTMIFGTPFICNAL